MKRLVTLVALVVVALVALDAHQRDAAALPAGLVAAYSFSEGTGTSTIDHSGLNNIGTISGATWSTSGRYGNALSFDGVNDIVTVNDAASLDLTNGMTLSAWVRPATLTGYKTAVMKERPGNLAYALYANTTGNRPAGEITNSGSREVTGTSKVASNAWTYLTTTYNGSQLRLYVNGSLVRTVNTSGNIVVSGGVLTIGGNRVWSNEFFNGLIDEVRVYNRALSASEITTDMNTALVDTTGPTVSITGPASSPALQGIVNITASASDPSGVAGVQFLVNGNPVGAEDTTSAYSVSWDTRTVPNSTYALSARARDASGNITTSAAVNRTVNNPVDTTLPNVSITAPTGTGTLSGTVAFTATATDNVAVAGVTFLVDNVVVGTEDTVSPYSISWNTTAVTNGTHSLTARARDTAGNLRTSTAVSVNVQNGPDTTPPTASITAPLGGASLNGTVNITANAADNVGVAGVTFLLDGTALGAEDTTAPYSYSWNTTSAANGPHNLTVRARDLANNLTTSAPVAITVDNPDITPPTAAITAPAAGPVSGAVNITANAADNIAVAGVTFLLNGNPLGPEDTVAPYGYSWDTTTSVNGPYSLTIRARDAANNQTTSTAIAVTVNNVDTAPPTVSITAPGSTPPLSGTVNITADAADNVGVAGVMFLLNGISLGPEDTVAPFSYSWDTATAANGPYNLTARARDAANNQTLSAVVAVTVSNVVDVTPPAVSITAPSGLLPLSGMVSVTASATDAVGVAGVQFLLNGSPLGPEDTAAPYTYSWDTTSVANGPYNLAARARDAATNQTTSIIVAVTVNNTDTTPPTVSITAPPATPPLSGTVSVTADAADNIGIAGVQVLLNGNPLGAEDTVAPFAFSWDTTTAPNGPHALTARARDAANNQTTSAVHNVTVSNGDVQPPAVAITAPVPGANVSANVGVEATATDDVGVVGVQFKLDGVNLGAEDLVAPYAAVWNSTGATFGSHTLTAVARDASGKSTTSASVAVNIVDPNGASQIGSWSPVINLPMVAVHTVLMSNGNILMWDAWESGVTTARIWNPTTNTSTPVFIESQIFCAAQSYLPDGRILVTGGHDGGGVGIVDASIFNPATNSWARIANMELPRWYPASVELGDGRVAILGGEIAAGLYADFAEVYNPYTNSFTTLAPSTASMHDSEYPLGFLLPDNRVFAIATTPGSAHILDVANQTWSNLGSVQKHGSAAAYAPGKIIYTGGGNKGGTAQPGAKVIDFNQGSPSWRTIAPMNFGRMNHSMVMMPDGKMIAVGGSTIVDNIAHTGVKTPELFDPAIETWRNLAPQAQNRMYHSIAMLLPDGRILSAGGGRWSTNVNYDTAEFYSPPYLFNGPRPTISGGPSSANHGSGITITTPNAADIARVSLISLASATHTMDMNQHFVALNFTKNAGTVTATIPSNSAMAPPGPYMVFIVNSAGVPSVAHMMTLNATTETTLPAVSLTAPASGATLTGNVTLSATATDASGIHSVEFFAGTTSIGKAATANPYTLSWNTSTPPNGSYALTAVATDIYGNTKTSAAVNITVNNAGNPITNGLVLALGFNEGTGTAAGDLSGRANNGTVAGAGWTAGKYGQGLNFDGVNDWVTVNDSTTLDLTNGMTLSAWVRPDTLSGWKTVLLKERPGHLAYSLYASAGATASGEIFTTSGWTVSPPSALPLGAWSHLAATYDGDVLRFYLNGALVASRPEASGNITVSGSALRIGGNGIWGDEFFDGIIDEVRVYNRALNATEVQTVMNTPVQ